MCLVTVPAHSGPYLGAYHEAFVAFHELDVGLSLVGSTAYPEEPCLDASETFEKYEGTHGMMEESCWTLVEPYCSPYRCQIAVGVECMNRIEDEENHDVGTHGEGIRGGL